MGSGSSRPRTSTKHSSSPVRPAWPASTRWRSGRSRARDTPSSDGAGDDVARIFRQESGRVVAHLIRRFGDMSLAEEAVQDAFVRAAERWPVEGVPPNPGGWITTVARNRALDVVRRESTRGARELAAVPGEPSIACCHPALAPEARVALTLRLLGGLTTAEIARAFLVPEPTMAARITRAKKKIALARIPYRVPSAAELPDRLGTVLAVLYLVFNEGYFATSGESLTRAGLAGEAIHLARVLVGLMPDEPEAMGLLALMLLTEARRAARTDGRGRRVRLPDQDRTLWDRELIAEGRSLVEGLVRRNRPGPYQIRAAIAAVHTDAARAGDTDWVSIVGLYDLLLTSTPSDVVRLNRAIAVAEVDGADAGLALLSPLALDGYGPFHVTRAELLRRSGRTGEARSEYERALAVSENTAEREHLRRRSASLEAGTTSASGGIETAARGLRCP